MCYEFSVKISGEGEEGPRCAPGAGAWRDWPVAPRGLKFPPAGDAAGGPCFSPALGEDAEGCPSPPGRAAVLWQPGTPGAGASPRVTRQPRGPARARRAPRPEEQGPGPVAGSPRSQGMHRLPPQPVTGLPACVPPPRPHPVPTHQAGNALGSAPFGPGLGRARRQRRRGAAPPCPLHAGGCSPAPQIGEHQPRGNTPLRVALPRD